MIEVPRTPSLGIFANKVLPELSYRGLALRTTRISLVNVSLELCVEAAGLNPLAIWTFGQDMEDLIKCSWVNADLPDHQELDEYLGCTPQVQQAIDDSGFANTVMILAQKT